MGVFTICIPLDQSPDLSSKDVTNKTIVEDDVPKIQSDILPRAQHATPFFALGSR
jgi:hypothetical protein